VNSLPLYATSKKLRSEKQIIPWIRSIDYHLECCIGARFWKIAIEEVTNGVVTKIFRPEDSLPRGAISKRLRYEKQIKAIHLFRLLSLEMLHRRVEIEKQGRSWCQPLQWLQDQILTYNSVLNVKRELVDVICFLSTFFPSPTPSPARGEGVEGSYYYPISKFSTSAIL
jgi:hypothetical protein